LHPWLPENIEDYNEDLGFELGLGLE
jgi:hypothetical protein